jgi:GntR family transcriptional regulator/MocR family aminotransferase
MRRFIPAPDSRAPVSQKTRWTGVATSLRHGIASGKLAPGDWLPPMRELARTFGVHRHTVQLAVDVLVAEGLLETSERRGVRVTAAELPRPRVGTTRATGRSFPGFRLVDRGGGRNGDGLPTVPSSAIALHAGTPDPSLLPLPELRSAYAKVLSAGRGSALATVDARGLPELRAEIVRYLRRARGLVVDDVLVTHGSQDAISLVAQVLIEPGDAVVVEDPGYLPAVNAFRALGAEIVAIPVDAHGIRVDLLEKALAKRRARMLYVTPNHQFPTTATLSSPRRTQLLALSDRHGVPILEDDYDHEYHYRGTPQAPLAAWNGASHVLYVGTMSKLVAPGLRVGFAAGDARVLRAMAKRRETSARGNDGITQAALATWMREGGFERHVRRARRVYSARRDAALATLARAAVEAPFEHSPPDGGLAIWTQWPRHDVVALARRALTQGVAVLPEPPLRVTPAGRGIRLAFGGVSETQFAKGIERLTRASAFVLR